MAAAGGLVTRAFDRGAALTAWAGLRFLAGASCAASATTLPLAGDAAAGGCSEATALNDSLLYGAEVGALGTALSDAGVGRAIIANGDHGARLRGNDLGAPEGVTLGRGAVWRWSWSGSRADCR